jgi:poly(A) polymerase
VREEGFDELLKLMRVDCLASHGDLSTYAWLKDYSENMPPEDVHPEPLLTGNDLIELGYVPGPLFKEILTALEDAQLEGEIDQRDAALDFVQKRWPITTPN